MNVLELADELDKSVLRLHAEASAELRRLHKRITELEQAVVDEREACAKVCDEFAERDKLSNYYAVAARAIRARGETK